LPKTILAIWRSEKPASLNSRIALASSSGGGFRIAARCSWLLGLPRWLAAMAARCASVLGTPRPLAPSLRPHSTKSTWWSRMWSVNDWQSSRFSSLLSALSWFLWWMQPPGGIGPCAFSHTSRCSSAHRRCPATLTSIYPQQCIRRVPGGFAAGMHVCSTLARWWQNV